MPANTPSASFLLIVAFICITIGYVFGWVISNSHKKRAEKSEQDESRDRTDVAAVVQTVPAQAIEWNKPDRAALFRLLRTPNGDGWAVDIGGTTFASPEEMTLDDRKRVETALRTTAEWMGLAYSLGEPALTRPVDVPTLVEVRAPVTMNGITEEQPRPAKVLADMTVALADALQPSSKIEAPKSIVEQIDAIFQAKLLGTQYESQKVYLAEDPKRGVLVRVGDKVYEGVGSLPEGEIKVLLRSSVSEWERQQEQKSRRIG